MGMPGQVRCYCNSKVLSCLDKNQIATMDGIGGCNRFPFPSYSDDLTFAWVERHLPVFHPLLQFAKSREMESTFCGMSFVCSKNKRGPSTLPCGTPEVNGPGPDVCPSTSTRWLLLARKLLIHTRRLPLTP